MNARRETVYFNGTFTAKEDVQLSPDDRGFVFADGVYEVIRSYGGRLFETEAHLQRMARGLAALRITGVDTGGLAAVGRKLLQRNGLRDADALIYVQVTRGAAPRRHAFPDPPVEPTVYAATMPFTPRGDPAEGVAVVTVPDLRWSRCDIKSVALLPNVLANQTAQEAGALEAIFVRDGVALEGTASSFFAVFDGGVRTAPNSNYILPSITREVALALCREHGIPACEEPILLDDLPGAEELFLAGTTVEIMPIVRVDGSTVRDGRPGPVTRRLLALLQARTGSGRTPRAARP